MQLTLEFEFNSHNSTVKFLGVTLDENLTLNDHLTNVTTKISKSVATVGVMRRLHCHYIVMRRLHCRRNGCYTILWCFSISLMRYWHGEGRHVLMLQRLSALTGEHANYSQIITIGSSLFTQFMITLLY